MCLRGRRWPPSFLVGTSYLAGDASLREVAAWLRETLPEDACYSLGVMLGSPAGATDLNVAWVLGADVLNTSPADRTEAEQRTVDEMLARRGRVDLW